MEQLLTQGDNQQESLLWWLGGIIDGEGCITINHRSQLKKNSLLFSPAIIITNTNEILIKKCQEILQANNLPFYVSYREKRKSGKVPCWWIVIAGIKRCTKALNLITKYLIAKKEVANLVKRFCESRLARNKEFNSDNGREKNNRLYGGMSPYNDEEFAIIKEVAKIHNRNPQRLYAGICEYKNHLSNRVIITRNSVNGRFESQNKK